MWLTRAVAPSCAAMGSDFPMIREGFSDSRPSPDSSTLVTGWDGGGDPGYQLTPDEFDEYSRFVVTFDTAARAFAVC